MTLHIAKDRRPLVYRWPLPTLIAGTSWISDIQVWDETGQPADLTGAIVTAKICDNAWDESRFRGTTVTTTPGVIAWSFLANALSGVETGSYRFVLDVDVDGIVQRLIDAALPIQGGYIYRPPSTALPPPGPGPDPDPGPGPDPDPDPGPDPDPDPTPVPDPDPPPPIPGPPFPNEDNTGPSGTMIDMTGDMIVNVPGTFVEGIRLAGSITVTASECTIRNCEVNATGAYGISGDGVDDLQVINVKVTGTGGANGVAVFNGGLVKNCEISGFENGIRFGGYGVTIQENYIHGLTSAGVGPLIDGIQTTGAAGVLISHNTIVNAGQSNVFLKTDYGPITSVRITDNSMQGIPLRNVVVTLGTGSNVVTSIEIDHNTGQRGSSGDFAVDTGLAGFVNIHDNTLSGADPIPPSTRVVTGAQTLQKATQASSIVVPGAPFIPTASNVGYLVSMGALTNSTGPLTTTSNGQVIELKHFLVGHYIRVQHNNVIIRKCVVDANDFYSIRIVSGTGTIIEDTTINEATNGISGGAMTVRRCKITGCENSVNVEGGNTTIQDNWMGAFPDPGSGGGVLHLDGIQIDGAVNSILIQNNTIENDWDNTSSVMLDNLYGAVSNVTVTGNRLSGGSYSIYVDSHFGADNMTNIIITNNKFTWPGVYGYGSIEAKSSDNVTWSGNVDNVGATIPKP